MFSAETFRLIHRSVTVGVLVLAPFPFGSVGPFWVAVWTAVLSASAICGVTAPIEARQRSILLAFLVLCSVYALVAVAQVTPNLIDQLDDSIWQRASEILGLSLPLRISSRAEIPVVSIGHFLLFVSAFLNGYFVGTSRRYTDFLIFFARYSILLYAVYGVVALAFAPTLLLWIPKVAYRGSLTATFVNHNTAATFIGAGTILWLCFACSSLQSLRISSVRLLLLTRSSEEVALKAIGRSAGALACFFALLMTDSRGGLICACLGSLFAIALMIASRLRSGFWYMMGSASVALAVVAFWLSQTGRIGSHGLFDDARWSVFEICLRAIRQRPLLGAGLGTFGDIFPSLRPDDFNSWGVWDYAHSTILEIAVEMGVPVAAMVVTATFGSLLILARAAAKSTDRSRRVLAAIAGILVLSYLHSMIDFSLQIPGYLIVFGILLGCGLARAALVSSREVNARSAART